MNNVRRVTNDIISAVEDGFLSWEEVARAALNYMSEDEVADMADINDWAIDLDEEDEEDEISNILNRLTEDQLDKIWEIAERYNTSRPVSGNWETEALHERDAIAKELGLTKEEANEVMVEYLGFEPDQLKEDFNNSENNNLCPYCGKKVNEKDGRCYNSDCEGYDPLSQYFDEDEYQENLLKDNFNKLNFHSKDLLVGNIELEYDSLPVMDFVDNDVEVPFKYEAIVSPEMVIDFICIENMVNEDQVTVEEMQKLIDDLAENPEPFYDYLKEYFNDEAIEEAQYHINEDFNSVDDKEELLNNNFDKIEFYKNFLWGDLELEYTPIEFTYDGKTPTPHYDDIEPTYPETKKLSSNFTYRTFVEKEELIDYIFDKYNIFSDDNITINEFQTFVDQTYDYPDDYYEHLKQLHKEDAEEDAYEYFIRNEEA